MEPKNPFALWDPNIVFHCQSLTVNYKEGCCWAPLFALGQDLLSGWGCKCLPDF
jgi:hypothetical protein